ncbi:MAG: nitroreductase family protein [Ruminiclostridium sp.]|nr:nitroreductase family protein [Ruminiclostridium sp.]
MIYQLIRKNRSYRRFYQEVAIDRIDLEELIDLARLSSSGANLQSLKYIISCEPGKNSLIFPQLKWAGYLADWNGPEEGEKPSAYIVMLLDRNISSNCYWDHGIACQSILLGACEKGLGGCMIASFDKVALRNSLKIPESYEPLLVIALGKPKETVVLEELNDSGSIKYWRDSKGVHHVPKRNLKDLILKL